MDNATIQQLAAEIVKHLPTYSWGMLAIQAMLMVAAAATGSFAMAYLKTRGTNLATKGDFESLQEQLHANTELVTTIKAEVDRREWAQREWTNLRRVKLEALIQRMHDCEDYLTKLDTLAKDGLVMEGRDPIGELDTMSKLYLPELRIEALDYGQSFMDRKISALRFSRKVHRSRPDFPTEASKEYIEEHDRNRLASLVAIDTLEKAARTLLLKISGVEVGERTSGLPATS